MEKPHKFDIGEGYGIWEEPGRGIMRSFPDVFYRTKPGDSAGKYTIGDMAVMNQPTTKKRFGMFVIAKAHGTSLRDSGGDQRVEARRPDTASGQQQGKGTEDEQCQSRTVQIHR